MEGRGGEQDARQGGPELECGNEWGVSHRNPSLDSGRRGVDGVLGVTGTVELPL